MDQLIFLERALFSCFLLSSRFMWPLFSMLKGATAVTLQLQNSWLPTPWLRRTEGQASIGMITIVADCALSLHYDVNLFYVMFCLSGVLNTKVTTKMNYFIFQMFIFFHISYIFLTQVL